MNEKFLINLIPFRYLKTNISIQFSKNEKENYKRIRKFHLPRNLQDEIESNPEGYLFWNYDKSSGEQENTSDIDLSDPYNRFIAKAVLNFELYKHFENENCIINQNFINDTQVWIPVRKDQASEIYKKYTLKLDAYYSRDSLSLFLSYDGESYVQEYKQAIDKADLGKIIIDNKVCLASEIDEIPSTNAKIKCNRDLNQKYKLGIDLYAKNNPSRNHYKEYFEEINSFYNKYLKTKIIGNLIQILDSGFSEISTERLKKVTRDKNLLEFKNGKRNYVVMDGLREAGPYKLPENIENLEFVFIFQEEDKDYANKLHIYLKKGYRNFPGFSAFTGLNYKINSENSVRFKSFETVIQDIEAKFKTNPTAKKIFAFYISPISKDEEEEDRNPFYFKIKETLLRLNISSQTIVKKSLNDSNFNFYLTNISLAVIAKLGGSPWKLPFSERRDLIVGFGAYNNRNDNLTVVGNAVSFNNDGHFNEFSVFKNKDLKGLGASFKQYIENYINSVGNCDRVIVHYYKDVNRNEKSTIQDILGNLNISIPYIFVSVFDTNSKDYVFFEDSYSGKMPVSGTILKLNRNTFLLCNNTRYSDRAETKIESFPLPIKIKIESDNPALLDNTDAIRYLIDQVYAFSRLYWKSVRQKSRPVTIEYSKLIAKFVSGFTDQTLPDSEIAKHSLWFL